MASLDGRKQSSVLSPRQQVGNLQDLIQFIFAGLTGGAIYALVALGFGVVHNTMGIVNFTQVDFVSLGGMVLYSALFTAGLPMPAALAAAILGVTLAAMVVEELGVRPSRSQSHLVLIFLTIGLSIILRGLMKLVWGKNRLAVPPLSTETPVHLLGRLHPAPDPVDPGPHRPGHRPAGALLPPHLPGAGHAGGGGQRGRGRGGGPQGPAGQGRELRPGRGPGGSGRAAW